MNKLAFTICSNNYLAQAKTLFESMREHNPDYGLVIVLCDRKSDQIDYSFFEPVEIIEIHNLGIEKFDLMVQQYNIVELNTSIKPFVFNFLYKNRSVDTLMYLDPDIKVFGSFTQIEQELSENAIILTPHICTPLDFDGHSPTENTFTQYGIFNLGFLATNRHPETFKLLDWWMKRLETNCLVRPQDGIFVDQLPMNYAPVFFKDVQISHHLGLNAAPWNLHERTLNYEADKYFINENSPLVFYHFSNYNPLTPETLSKYYTRLLFEQNTYLKQLYDEYKEDVLKNQYEKFSTIKCFYTQHMQKSVKKPSIFSQVINYIKRFPIFRKDFWLSR